MFQDMSEILKRFGDDCEFTGEYKYDGERAQIHVNKDGSMNIFRNWFKPLKRFQQGSMDFGPSWFVLVRGS